MNGTKMGISRKLLLVLSISVGIIMFFASVLSLRQYENALKVSLVEDLKSHSITLQIAIEEYYAKGREGEIQSLIDRIHSSTDVYSILLYNSDRQLLTKSLPLKNLVIPQSEELSTVLTNGQRKQFSRELNGRKFAAIIVPVTEEGKIIGAVELLTPLSLVETDVFYARFYWILTTVLIIAAISLVVFFVLRTNLTQPINHLLEATDALAKGDLGFKVSEIKRSDEIGRLASQFNQMADSLNAQYDALKDETEVRLKLEREIRHNEQLVSVGRMAAGVAHELGAPLNVIDARADQLLKKEDLTDERKRRNLEIIRSNVARITHLVRQLLNLARPFNLNIERIDVERSINNSLEQLEWNIEEAKIKTQINLKKDLFVAADTNYLTQVWLNIFINAIQELAEGGTIFVDAWQEADLGVIEVRDTGSGIPEEHFVYLFDPFFTTKDVGKGTGLGLPIANRIIEEHGGKIRARNHTDGGAVFTVYLPLFIEKD